MKAFNRVEPLLSARGQFQRLETIVGIQAHALDEMGTGGAEAETRAYVWRTLGRLRIENLGDTDGAIEAFEHALEAEADADTLSQLANLYAARGREGDAHQAADLYCTLGDALGAPDGIAFVEAALNIAPDHEESLVLLESLVPEKEHNIRLEQRWAAFLATAPDGPATDKRRRKLAQLMVGEDRHREALDCITPLANKGDQAAMNIQEGLCDMMGIDVPPRPHVPIRSSIPPPRSGDTLAGLSEAPAPEEDAGATGVSIPGAAPVPGVAVPETAARRVASFDQAAEAYDETLTGVSAPSDGEADGAGQREETEEDWAALIAKARGRAADEAPGKPAAEKEDGEEEWAAVIARARGQAETDTVPEEPKEPEGEKPEAPGPPAGVVPPAAAPVAAPQTAPAAEPDLLEEPQRLSLGSLFPVADDYLKKKMPVWKLAVGAVVIAAALVGAWIWEEEAAKQAAIEEEQKKKAEEQALVEARKALERAREEARKKKETEEAKKTEAEKPSARIRLVTRLLRMRGGSVDRHGFIKAVQSSFPEMEKCYDAALKVRPRLKGRLVLGWTVKLSGNAGAVARAGGTIKNPTFARCAAGAIRNTRFPKPRGRPVKVRLPFVFDRPES
jgi:tetratricopeptide (TPR) repeat protein